MVVRGALCALCVDFCHPPFTTLRPYREQAFACFWDLSSSEFWDHIMQELLHSNQKTTDHTSRQAAFHQWLLAIPQDSLARLRVINTSTSSSRHVILSLTFALYDTHIRRLNRIITALLIARLKAERAGKTRLVARINNVMNDMHGAIDQATDQATASNATKQARGSPCNRSAQRNLAM